MFRNRLIKLLDSFNLAEAQKLLDEISAHKQTEDGSLLSLEEEKMWEQLSYLVDEYKKYH